MKIAIASGKGGTGKTTVALNLALSLDNAQLMDCDVENPNCHLFLEGELETVEHVNLSIPVIDKDKCTNCGKCADFCRYNALLTLPKETMFFQEMCHGCGGCTLVCPENAISEKPRSIGIIRKASMENINFWAGLLNVGEPMSTPVIRQLKSHIEGSLNMSEQDAATFRFADEARNGSVKGLPTLKNSSASLSAIDDSITNLNMSFNAKAERDVPPFRVGEPSLTILDSPPGTACPVIETISDSDFVILVTEPTPFGLHDLKLAIEVVRMMELPFGVIVNRQGVGDNRVQEWCKKQSVQILMEIPQSQDIARLYSQGKPFVLEMPEWKLKFQRLFSIIKEMSQ